jgi:two-component system NtrC family response regulator
MRTCAAIAPTAPLVIVNCATISRDLAESQLFGHSKGAFTGAVAESAGFFGQADGGTLFLDEIGELSLEVQSKLLRAIEYGEIQALGSSATVKVSVSLIVASNRDLAGLVGQRSFRQDLFYRINQVPVAIPGLEQRREDIPALIDFWARSLGADPPLLGEEAIEYLCARSWPGNVRELKNLLQRLIVLCEHRPIGLDELRLLDNARGSDAAAALAGDEQFWREPLPLGMARRRLEKRYLETQLAVHGWSVKATAAALNILPGNLSRRLGELDIKNRI